MRYVKVLWYTVKHPTTEQAFGNQLTLDTKHEAYGAPLRKYTRKATDVAVLFWENVPQFIAKVQYVPANEFPSDRKKI